MIKTKPKKKLPGAKAAAKPPVPRPIAKVAGKVTPLKPSIGHNSGDGKKTVKASVAKIEELSKRQREIGKSIREEKAFLKSQGVNTTALNQVLRERKMEPDVRKNFYEDCHIVRDALEMQPSLFDRKQFEEGQRGPDEADLEKSGASVAAKKAEEK